MVEPISSIGGRHLDKPDSKKGALPSPDFSDVSVEGEAAGRVRAVDIFQAIKGSPDGSVFVFAGATDKPRAGQSLEIYADEINKLVAQEGRDDIEVIRVSDLFSENEARDLKKHSLNPEVNPNRNVEDLWLFNNPISRIVRDLQVRVNSNPAKKYVICAPLFMKGLSVTGTNEEAKRDEKGRLTEELTPYFKDL